MNQQVIFVLLTTCNSLTMMGLSLITPFFPPFALEKGVNLFTLGFIISANPIGNLIASLFLGKRITEANRFRFIIIGMLLQSIGLFIYVALNWIDNLIFFIIIATLGRAIGGVGTAFFLTPYFAYIPILFPNQIEKKIAVAEFISGLAQLVGIKLLNRSHYLLKYYLIVFYHFNQILYFLGPVFGSLLYSLGGYTIPFVVFGSLDLILIPILLNILRKNRPQKRILQRMNYSSLGNDQSIVTQEESLNKISYFSAFMNYQVFMQFWTVLICNICFTYFQPIIAAFYLKEYNINGNYVGYLMSLVTAGYTLGTFVLAGVKKRKRLMVFLGLFVLGGPYFFIGPDKGLTGLKHHLWISLVSQFILGLGTPPVYLPSVPLLNDILASLYPAQKLEIANISSAIFNSGSSIGQFIGPIVSGWVTQQVDYDRSFSCLGFFIIGSALLYFPMIFIKQNDSQQDYQDQQDDKTTTITNENFDSTTKETHPEIKYQLANIKITRFSGNGAS